MMWPVLNNTKTFLDLCKVLVIAIF